MLAPVKVKKPLILYGKGKLGKLAVEIFEELKIPIYEIMDKDDIEYLIIEDIFLVAVCVATSPYLQLEKFINAHGFNDVVPLWEIVEAYPELKLHNGWMDEEVPRNKYRPPECIYRVSRVFKDLHSQIQYRYFACWHLYSFAKEVITLDANSEVLPSTLADIRKRQKVVFYEDKPVSYISIHAEGCELEILKCNLHIFRKYRPTIRIACYHSYDGYNKIIRFLQKSLAEYEYEYEFSLCAYMGQAAYVTCLPQKERYNLRYYDKKRDILSYTGVHEIKTGGRTYWAARSRSLKKHQGSLGAKHLGCFRTVKEAAMAFDRERLSLHNKKKQANINFPRELYGK